MSRPKQPHGRTPLTKAERESAIKIYNEEDPESVINYLPPKVAVALKQIPIAYLTWSEQALRNHSKPTEQDHRIRLAIWHEFDFTIERGRDKMSLNEALRGVCPRSYFYNQVLIRPKLLAWIFYPPEDYTKFMKEVLFVSMKQIRKIMTSEHEDENGKLDHKLINHKIKIWEKLEQRIQGAIPQALNVSQKSVNYNVNAPVNAEIPVPTRIEDIDAELARIEKKEKKKQIEQAEVIETKDVDKGEIH